MGTPIENKPGYSRRTVSLSDKVIMASQLLAVMQGKCWSQVVEEILSAHPEVKKLLKES